jgi:hypothetical protein
MSVTSETTVGAHLCGSVPLPDSRAVFRAVAGELGSHVKRIPDGETGERDQWIGWAAQVFWRVPGLEVRHPFYEEYSPRVIGLADGVGQEDITYPDLGYAQAALASYEEFAALKRDGAIASDVRFQVSLPTPIATISAAVAASELATLERGYEAAMLDELRRILAGVPHTELAIQWDVCLEVSFKEGWITCPFEPIDAGITERLVRYAAAVPQTVELGFHLCYGDYKHQHLHQPDDCRACVEIVNAASLAIGHHIDWVHIPVPLERDDDGYFAPLDELDLADGTELYLGLIHYRDGVDGARRRIATARRHAAAFGVATECGMGRRPADRGGSDESLRQLLAIHRAVSSPVR